MSQRVSAASISFCLPTSAKLRSWSWIQSFSWKTRNLPLSPRPPAWVSWPPWLYWLLWLKIWCLECEDDPFCHFSKVTWPWKRRRAVILGWQTAAPSTGSLRKPPATTLTRLGTRSSSLALTLAKLWDYFLVYFVMTAMHWCNHKIHCEIICNSCLNTSIKEM